MIMIYGATGGIGKALCTELIKQGRSVIAAGRNLHKLTKLSKELKIEYRQFDASGDLRDIDLHDVSHIINCSGVDIRKELKNQNPEDIHAQINANLLNVINLTQRFLSLNTQSTRRKSIMHIGGFTDGSWPSYGYSIDVATRSAAYSFLESIRLENQNQNIKLQYFCPLPTHTEAEKPYHNLWKEQGIKILPLEKVVSSIIQAMDSGKEISIMGDFFTRKSPVLRRLLPGIFKPVIRSMARSTQQYFKGAL